MRQLLDWMYWETPEYFGLPPKAKKLPEPVIEVTEEVPAVIKDETEPAEVTE